MSSAPPAPADNPALSSNIASHLPRMARLMPDKRALSVAVKNRPSEWDHATFAELDAASDRYAHGLERIGICRGVRTVLMVRPSVSFFALVFALFKVGAVLVLIDPGIGVKGLNQCLARVKPEAFIGIPMAHVARLLFGRALRSMRILVTVGRKLGWGGVCLEDLERDGDPPYPMAPTQPDEVAAVLFTSGSTGIPKGAVYTHGNFDAQVRMLSQMFNFADDEIDLATFPLFALFDPALGMTAVVPDMDARKPGSADPAKIIDAITTQGCTNVFGSPALLANLGRHGVETHTQLPSVRRILSAGAPARPQVLAQVSTLLSDNAEIYTPYGATEALPVALIGSRELLDESLLRQTAEGHGICVGRPVAGMTVRIIGITDDAIATWSDDLCVPPGQIGEITARGPVVTGAYWGHPDQTALAKIDDGGQTVHRMGDLGFIDDQGRIWMCGRKSHRVQTADATHFTLPVERIFDAHPAVCRTALVGLGPPGRAEPVVLIEPAPKATVSKRDLVDALTELGAQFDQTRAIQRFELFRGVFPTDIRHNAKIVREDLTVWANRRLR